MAAIEEGVSWFSYWDSHDVDRKFVFTSLEYSLGMNNDARVQERGRVFKQLAETYRGKEVKFSTATLPPPPRQRTQEGTWRWILDGSAGKKQDRSAGVSPAVAEASRPRDFIPRTANFPQA